MPRRAWARVVVVAALGSGLAARAHAQGAPQPEAPAAPAPSASDDAGTSESAETLAHKKECIAFHAGVQRARAAGRLREARERALTCSRDVCPAVIRGECGTWLDELAREQPSIVLAARDKNGHALTRVTVREVGDVLSRRLDGAQVTLDPGVHTLRFEKDGVAQEVQVLVRVGDHARLVEVVLPDRPILEPRRREPAPSTRRRTHIPTTSWILGGVAGGALLSATYFGVTGLSKQRDLEQTCAPRCPGGDVDAMQRRYVAADISLGVAIAAAAGAVWFALSQPDASTERAVAGGAR